MANERYAVPFQAFITDGAVITCAEAGRVATAGNTTLNLSTTGGAGTFTITLGSGCTGTVTSGTATITGSVLALAAGANTVTSNGAGTCTLNLTLGTAANWNTVNTWSAASGGVSGASVPASTNSTYFDANSFSAGGQTVTVDAIAYCLGMDWTGATNSPSMYLAASCRVYGNVTLLAGTPINGTGNAYLHFYASGTLTSNGAFIYRILSQTGITLTLGSDFLGNAIYQNGSYTLDTAGYDVEVGALAHTGTLTMGDSIITITTVGKSLPGRPYEFNLDTGATVTANTATIICLTTTGFSGSDNNLNGLTVNLNGTAHTMSGSFSCNSMRWGRAGTQAITGTAGNTYTIKHLYAINGANVITVASTGAAWTVTGNTGYCELDYVSMTNCVAGQKYLYYAGDHSTNTSGNTDWIFTRKTRPALHSQWGHR